MGINLKPLDLWISLLKKTLIVDFVGVRPEIIWILGFITVNFFRSNKSISVVCFFSFFESAYMHKILVYFVQSKPLVSGWEEIHVRRLEVFIMLFLLIMKGLSHVAEKWKVVSSAIMQVFFIAFWLLLLLSRSDHLNFVLFRPFFLRYLRHDCFHNVKILLINEEPFRFESWAYSLILSWKFVVNFDHLVESNRESA